MIGELTQFAFIDPISIALIGSSILGGIFSNRKQKIKQESESTSSTRETQRPTYTQEEEGLKNDIISRYLARMDEDDGDYWDAYRRQGAQTLETGEKASNRAIQQFLASRGLGGTGAGASAGIQSGLASNIARANFSNQIPILADQRKASNLGDAGKFFATLPYGQEATRSTTSRGTQTTTTPGNMLGGGLTGGAAALAQLYGAGAFDKKGGSSGPNLWDTASAGPTIQSNANPYGVIQGSYPMPSGYVPRTVPSSSIVSPQYQLPGYR